ncbi:MAG: hypothetical protein JNL32_02515 [Candidatus Kapabacteria bacterium]|nr:hypothetical protein [Candidatus Kapabacteria bacterium]
MNDYSRLGQAAIGTTTATDYQAIGMNPANLGFIPTEVIYKQSSPMEAGISRRKRNWSVSVGEFGAAVHSNAMGSSDLLGAIFSFNEQQFSLQEKYEAARKFAGKSVYMNADAIILGVSYQSDAYGGFAFTIRDRVSGEFTFNSAAANLAFLGRNFNYFDSSYTLPWNGQIVGVSRQPQRFSQLFDSTRLSMSWTREFNLGYGRRVFNGQSNKLYLGITFRYILGYAYLDSYTDPNTKTLEGYSSITPLFNINYGKATSPSTVPGTGMIPVGHGLGADFGLTYHIGPKWRVGASLLDVGKMYWTGNVYRAQDTILNGMSSTGFNSYNIFLEAQKITGDGGYFKWEGMTSIESSLPTRLRMGVSYSVGMLRDVGLDMIFPMTDGRTPNINTVLVSVGSNYQIVPWLYASGGMTFGGTMGYNIPLGVMFSIFDGFWEMGISTRDILTFLFEKNPTASLTAGVCRLRF